MSDTTTIDLMSVSTDYTSDSEFSLVKRVQLTNEIPPSSLYALLPSGLQNAFWKYFMGTSAVAYGVPASGPGGTFSTQIQKIVNGVVSSDYGPETNYGIETFNSDEDEGTYTSMDIEGVIEPELDLFLHELYRYLDTVYPDSPDYEYLLTPIEMNDAFYAAAAIIGYTPNYKFIEMWSQSITGTSLSREELKWKIRDLRAAAFRRKFAGSYSGYKSIFSSMYRHGAVYSTATYLPRAIDNTLDTENSNLFRMFRLIDYLGANDKAYETVSRVAFQGIVDPSDLFSVYEATPQLISDDSSSIPGLVSGAFIQDANQSLLPILNGGTQSGVTVQPGTVVESDNPNYQIHKIGLSGIARASSKEYILTHEFAQNPIDLVPRPFGGTGLFSLTLALSLGMYPDNTTPLTAVDLIPFGEGIISIGDTFEDAYVTRAGKPLADIAYITDVMTGRITIVTNPVNAPVITSTPPSSVLSGGFNVQIDSNTHVFLEGVLTYNFSSGNILSAATLEILCIPDINPITGETNNRALVATATGDSAISLGNYVDVCAFNDAALIWEIVASTYGWVDGLDYGYLETKQLTDQGVLLAAPTIFSSTNFTQWKQRAAATFNVEVSPILTGIVTGVTQKDMPTQISVIKGGESTLKAECLSAGDAIYGPGLQAGTIIVNATPSIIVISKPAVNYGPFSFRVTLRHSNGTSFSPKIFDFKKALFATYPTLTTSVFQFLWPSAVWPNVSQGHTEGVSDTSLYSYPTELPQGTLLPSNVYIDRNVFLDLSIDRILYHPNTLGLTGTQGQYVCLCDIPWLEYIDTFASGFKRATEQVYVGAQVNLATDISGLYSIVAGTNYTDPVIQSRFTTIPQYYNANPLPAYIQLGTGGSANSSLFVSIDDLIRPTVFQSAFYDQTGRDEVTGDRRRSTYLTNGAIAASSSSIRSQALQLEMPIFEVPIGEYENLMGPGAVDSKGKISYTDGLADPSNPTNSYQTIQSTIYAQQFANVVIDLGVENPLVLNSPATTALRRLPSSWVYKGDWSPSTREVSIQGGALTPDWPAIAAAINDYYVVTQKTTIGAYSFTAGDWIVWSGSQWIIKSWILKGILAGSILLGHQCARFLELANRIAGAHTGQEQIRMLRWQHSVRRGVPTRIRSSRQSVRSPHCRRRLLLPLKGS